LIDISYAPHEVGDVPAAISPRPAPMNDLGLEQADHRFGERIVVVSPTLPTDGSIPASASRSVHPRQLTAIGRAANRYGMAIAGYGPIRP
jgi:hypothetical protein